MSLNSLGLSRKARLISAAALGAALLASVLVLGSNDNANAETAPRAKQTVVLGAVGPMPQPQCPLDCRVLASVTGLQTEINGVTNPYRVPFKGKITKWKVALGSVTRAQRMDLQDDFGSPPQAGLSVLKRVTVGGKAKFELVKRSPIQGLNRDLGSVASYTLKKPIKVNKGEYVALTIPTWAPIITQASALKPRNAYSWRASRNRGMCGQAGSRPQQGIGSAREYGCRFTDQLLYRVKVTNK